MNIEDDPEFIIDFATVCNMFSGMSYHEARAVAIAENIEDRQFEQNHEGSNYEHP